MSDTCEWCKDSARDSECYLCALSRRSKRTEAETVTRIVAWLRAEGAAWSTSTEGREICASLAWAADAIARGDWKAGGGRDG